MENKLEHLKEYLKGLGSVAVAFSSGVDSTFLLKVAHDVLGDKAIAITAQSCSFPKRELNEAKAFCEKEGIKHVICQSEELEIEGFSKNPPNRCYLCKKELFEKIGDIAKKNGIEYIAEGSLKMLFTMALPEALPAKSTEWKFTRFRMYSTSTSFSCATMESSLFGVASPFTATCWSPWLTSKFSISRRFLGDRRKHLRPRPLGQPHGTVACFQLQRQRLQRRTSKFSISRWFLL